MPTRTLFKRDESQVSHCERVPRHHIYGSSDGFTATSGESPVMEPTSKQQQRSPGTRPTLLHSYRVISSSRSTYPSFFFIFILLTVAVMFTFMAKPIPVGFHEGLFWHLSHCSPEWSQFPSLKRIFDSRQMEPRKTCLQHQKVLVHLEHVGLPLSL